MCITHNDKFLCIQLNGPQELVKYNIETDEFHELDPIKTNYISQFELSPDNKWLVVTGYENGLLYIVDFDKETLFTKTNLHKSQADYLGFTSDQNFLITRSKTETIIWNCKEWTQFAFIEEKCAIITSSHRICNALIHDGLYKPWNVNILKDFSDDYQIDESNQDQNISIKGPFNKIVPLILDSMIQQPKSQRINFINALKSNTIMPYKYNLVHYFTFTNNPECLCESLVNQISYQRDQFGKSPIEYAMERNSYQCSIILLEYIMNKENIYGKMNEQELNRLITFSPSNLYDFFQNSIQIQEEQVPSFGRIKNDQEIEFITSGNYLLDPETAKNMLYQGQEIGELLPLEFKSLKFQYNLSPGSSSSINFHLSLGEANQETFKSEVIQNILTYKWNLVKSKAYLQAVLFATYLVFLTFFIIQSQQESYMMIIFLFFAVLQTVIETVQIALNRQAYFQDKFNYFDILRIIIIWFYCISSESQSSHKLLSFLNLISWLRGLSFLRLFKQTRVLIRLILEVTIEMKAFLIVLFFSLITFTLSFTSFQHEVPDFNFIGALGHNYKLMYGDFSDDNYNEPLQALFVLASLFMPLVMLNLLIAIMSDTYARVMENILPIDFQELNALILEQEVLMFTKRNVGKAENLSWVTYAQMGEGNSEYQGKISRVLNLLNTRNSNFSLAERVIRLQDLTESQDLKMKIMHKEIAQRFEDQKKKNEEMFLLCQSIFDKMTR